MTAQAMQPGNIHAVYTGQRILMIPAAALANV